MYMKTATTATSFLAIVLLLCSGSEQIAGGHEPSPCPVGCKKCSYDSNRQAVCDGISGCNTGYIFINGMCLRCPMYCDKCSLDSETASFLCLEHGCHEGYLLNDVTGVCEEPKLCHRGCKTCVYDTNDQLICDENIGCDTGYIFFNGRCLSIILGDYLEESTKEQDELTVLCAICWLWQYRLWIIGGAGVAASPVDIPAHVVAMGFGPGGIVAGSDAAEFMSLFATGYGEVAVGCFEAWLHSVIIACIKAVANAFAYLIGTTFDSEFKFIDMEETCESCDGYEFTCDNTR